MEIITARDACLEFTSAWALPAHHLSEELPFGDENFGNFHRSLYTMFQVLTGRVQGLTLESPEALGGWNSVDRTEGESWSEVVTRPMLHTTDFTQARRQRISLSLGNALGLHV